MQERQFFVYILSSRFKTLYIGVTNDLERRLGAHRARPAGTYTARYRIDRLVYFELFPTPVEVIAREKVLKGWKRETFAGPQAVWNDGGDWTATRPWGPIHGLWRNARVIYYCDSRQSLIVESCASF